MLAKVINPNLFVILNLIEGLIRFMNSNHKGPINLGNPEEITIKNLANLISFKVVMNLYEEMSLPLDDPIKKDQV